MLYALTGLLAVVRVLSPTVHSEDRERARRRVEKEGGWGMGH